MFEFVNYSAEQAQVLFLIILRVSGLFILAPILGHQTLPRTVKAGLLILVSLILTAAVELPPMPPVGSLWVLAGLALQELLVGFIIGLVFRLTFHAVHTAGSQVGYQMGFAVVTQYDKDLSGQVSVLGRLWYIVAVLVFLAINGHHLMLSGLADSYALVPIGGLDSAGAELGEFIIRNTAQIFVVALKIASPVMITLFVTDVALGTIAKTMPTMNVFFMGMPLKIAIGLTVMGLSLPVCEYLLQRTVGYFDSQLEMLFIALGKA